MTQYLRDEARIKAAAAAKAALDEKHLAEVPAGGATPEVEVTPRRGRRQARKPKPAP